MICINYDMLIDKFERHVQTVISNVISKVKDFLKLQAVAHTVKVVGSQCCLSLDMQAVKLCSNRIFQFLTKGVG